MFLVLYYTWSETYFRQGLFPAYLFVMRQFPAIVIFRLKSISDLDSGSLPRIFWWIHLRKIKNSGVVTRLDVKWPKLRSPVELKKMHIEIQYTCNLSVISQYCPCDMYIHLHTIGLIGVTEIGTVTCHLVPNRRRFHWSISRWILLCRKNIFGKSLLSCLSLFVPSFRFFQHLENMTSPFQWAFLTEISPWPRRYSNRVNPVLPSTAWNVACHYSDVIAPRHSSASLTFVRGIHQWPVNSPHKGPVTRKIFPFDDVIMCFITRGA